MQKMQSNDAYDTTPGRFRLAISAVSIVVVSGAVFYNAVFGQQTRVYSESRISINADATKLDKLFSVLNPGAKTAKPGRTRVKVQPNGNALPEPPATGSIERVIEQNWIEMAQGELQRLGYDPGPVDGRMGSKTSQALRAFQADMKLPVDGRVSPDLLKRLAATSDAGRNN